jgi:hypothetical protein
MFWIAGIIPRMKADPVIVLTKSGIMVENDARPRVNPKKPPSSRLTM